MNNNEPSPFDTAFHQHPSVVELKKRAQPGWLDKAEVLWSERGFTLYAFHEEVFYMLRTPGEAWKRAYLGGDQDFNHDVLEKTFGFEYVCDAKIPNQAAGQLIPIYAEPLMQRVRHIPIFLWMLRVAATPLVVGVMLVLAALFAIRDIDASDGQPIIPIWQAYGAWPWYVLLCVGLSFIFFSWARARQWQTGKF